MDGSLDELYTLLILHRMMVFIGCAFIQINHIIFVDGRVQVGMIGIDDTMLGYGKQ